jgi:hypothetical protein
MEEMLKKMAAEADLPDSYTLSGRLFRIGY